MWSVSRLYKLRSWLDGGRKLYVVCKLAEVEGIVYELVSWLYELRFGWTEGGKVSQWNSQTWRIGLDCIR